MPVPTPEQAKRHAARTQLILGKYRTRNTLVAGSLIAAVGGIYVYTMASVKQEDFSEYDKLPRQTTKT